MKVCPKCGKQYADDANFCTNDAGRLVAMSASAVAPAAAAAQLLGGRFEVRERVGGAVTGAVHRGIDTQSGTTVAIKLVAPAVVAQQGQRVERDLKLLERVQSAGVARILASGKDGQQIWAAEEWVEGAQTLAQVVGEGGMEPERASDVAIAVGGALVDAAKVGVVHRDLSPKNVLVTDGGIKLINFALPEPHERVGGVPAFVSPEVIEGKPGDQRSSTYSLGALYYFLLTGHPPFAGDDQAIHAAHLSGSAVPPSQRAAVAADVDSLVGRAMDRNPAKRYLTLKQFLDDIDRVRRGPEGGTGSTAPFGRAGLGALAASSGKRREPAATMLGVGAINEARTKQMDIQIPPEALREAAALDAAVASGSGGSGAAATPSATARMGSAQPEPGVASAVHAQAQAQAPHVPVPHVQAPPVAQPPPAAAGSPWAPPAAQAQAQAGAMTPAAQAVQAAAPAIAAAAQPQGPVMPATAKVAATSPTTPATSLPGGKKKQDVREKKKASKGKFRETMWFKKGDLDAAAAEAAAHDQEGAAPDKADSLPMEERYSDDGTITTSDAARYSLKTGHTGAMPVMRDGGPSSSVSEGDLIGEMKGGSRILLIVIAIAVLAIIGVVLAFAL